jgi:hypothetical protein
LDFSDITLFIKSTCEVEKHPQKPIGRLSELELKHGIGFVEDDDNDNVNEEDEQEEYDENEDEQSEEESPDLMEESDDEAEEEDNDEQPRKKMRLDSGAKQVTD